MPKLKLYHTGFDIIKQPDIHFGRKNADFSQGFYLSDNRDFAVRWARERKSKSTFINEYELECEGLNIKKFERNAEWFSYIFANRNGYADSIPEFDVITGPVANDTIYDIWGITTSGVLSEEQALSLLEIGPLYKQIVIKSDKAAEQLRWVSAEVLKSEEINESRKAVANEESEYQALVEEKLGQIAGLGDDDA